MNSYSKLLSIIGVVTFWLCLGSLLEERAHQAIDLPLNPFANWPDTRSEGRATDISLAAIFVCWPFILLTLHLLRRVAGKTRHNVPRWQRLPAPFGLNAGLCRWEDICYRLFFVVLFAAIPLIHTVHFSVRFFIRERPNQLFYWTPKDWFFGVDGPDRLYGGMSYFGWTPWLVLAGLIGIMLLMLGWFFAVLRHRSPK